MGGGSGGSGFNAGGGGGISAQYRTEFNSIDTNNDGMISAAEYAAARSGPNAAALSGGGAMGGAMGGGSFSGAASGGMGGGAMGGASMGGGCAPQPPCQ